MAKKHGNKRRARYTPQQTQTSSTAIPAELREAYAQFMRSVQEAQVNAEAQSLVTRRKPDDVIDLSQSVEIINRYPALGRLLEGMRQREDARKQAMGESFPSAVSYAVPGYESDFYSAGARGQSMHSPTGSHPQNQGAVGGWTSGGSKSDTPQGVPSAYQLRYFADNNEWVRAAINIRRQQIGRADIAVVPANEKKKWDATTMRTLQRLLDQPNELRDSYRSLIEPVVEDILVLDRGAISKNMNSKRQPVSLYYEDGATIKIYTNWSGKDSDYRYLYEEPGSTRSVPLRNDELICIMGNPATYRLGLSTVQYLMRTIKAEMRAIESASHLVDMKPPPHIVQIPGAGQPQINMLRNSYDSEVAGRKELFWMGGENEAKVFPLVFSARDNQWLEWQQYLAKKIATAFQISPQQFGFTDSVNKSTGEVQQQIYEDTGLIPLLLLLEEYLNRELLMDFCKRLPDGRADLESMNLRIIFPEVSEAERALHAEKAAQIAQLSMGGLPSATLNQILLMRGEEPVPGGNTFWVNTKNGPIPWVSYDQDYGDWNPLSSLGGMLGAQDPMGGLDMDEDTDFEDTGDDKNKKPHAEPGSDGADAGSAPSAKKKPSGGSAPKAPNNPKAPKAGDSSSSAGNVEAPNFSDGKSAPRPYRKRLDPRTPGRRASWGMYSFDFDEQSEESGDD